VLVNSRGHVLATGYNGVAAGLPHCNEGHPCAAANAPSGTQLEGCEAIHAEQNALLQCRNVYEIHTCYCTTAPCITCTKLLLNTSCQRIVSLNPYPTSGAELWTKAGRFWGFGVNAIEALGVQV
jgi:dCMP deaminase